MSDIENGSSDLFFFFFGHKIFFKDCKTSLSVTFKSQNSGRTCLLSLHFE